MSETVALVEPLLRTRVLACPTLPTLPAIALEVLDLCRRNDGDLDAVARVVGGDPAISARLLRLANSASIATRGKVTTLLRAIAIVGTDATLSTVLSFSLVRGRRRTLTARFDHAQFWRRVVFCAIAGRTLGELGGLDPEETFLACLLQDIGILALNEVFPGDYGVVFASAEGDHAQLAALEREALGVDHLEAGLLLAELWNLPGSLRGAIERSHQPGQGAGRTLEEIVFLSGPLADVWVGPATPARIGQALPAAERWSGASPELVGTALSRMALAVPEAAADFDLDLGDIAGVEAVLEQAHDLLRDRGGVEPADQGPAGAADAPEAERIVEEAYGYARAHGHAFAALLVAPLAAPVPGMVRALVRSCLRRTDVVGSRGETILALAFDPTPGGAAIVAGRIHRRAAEAGTPVAVGFVELRPGDVFAGVEELLATADRALAASRGDGGAPVWGSPAHAVSHASPGTSGSPGGGPSC